MRHRNRFQDLQPGDVVLVHYRNKFYAKVLEVSQRYYTKEQEDSHVESMTRWGRVADGVCECSQEYCPKAGQRYGDLVTFEKVYEFDFSPAKRKYRGTYDEAWMTKVDKKMIKEQEEKLLKTINNLKGILGE